MEHTPEANLQMLETLLRELYPDIKILNKDYFSLSYHFQVELNGKPINLPSIRRSIVDDDNKKNISTILKERLG